MIRTDVLLARSEWIELQERHRERADALTAARRERSARGATHPVDDFLYTYYSYKPSTLRAWHPGVGTSLADAEDWATRRWYGVSDGVATVDVDDFTAAKGPLLRAVTGILRATAGRNPRFGCFGLHEWAMVYRDPETRHTVPLRLGTDGTDAVVEASELHCTHVDAFRFFTPDAVVRNSAVLTREDQVRREQPGCLHANMDLYKWAQKLGPLVPGDLLLDAFELTRDIREIDMRASPYDLSDWGYTAIPIETEAGRADYVARQRAFSARAEPLRERLLRIAAA